MSTTAEPQSGDAAGNSNPPGAIATDIDDAALKPDLDATTILAAPDRRLERVFVKWWRGHVYIRTMSGTERDAFEASLVVGDVSTTENIRAKLLVQVLCDKNGAKLFTAEQVAALGEKSSAALVFLYSEAARINVISNADLEELAKNSGGGAIATS